MYRVLWVRAALDELATVWTESDSRQRASITTATNLIDGLLATDPQRQGESRTEFERVMFVPPIGVTYEVDPAQRLVRILQLWRFRQHR